MARIHLIGGEKGGVGKTFVCRCLAQYFLIQGWEFCLIDADTGIQDVSSVFESIPMTLSDDPHRYAEPDVLFNKALEKTVIVNLPSNTKEALNRWLRETSFLSFAQQYQVSLLYWFVTDGCYSSIKLLEKSLSEFDRQIPHLLIRNQGRLNGSDFSYLDRDDFYRQIVTASNLVQVVDFPKLGSEEQFFIDKYSLNLREAQLKAQEQNRIMSAQRIKSFVDQLLTVFEQVDFAGAIEAAAPSPAIKVRHTAKPSDLIENHKEAETV
jgi:hypothetical protein